MANRFSRNKQRVLHIKEACIKINNYLADIDKEIFLIDHKVQDAILYQIIVIGEAVGHIDKALLEKYPYPWFKIRALRNYAAHEYFNIQIWTIWEIAEEHISQLLDISEEILRREFRL